MLAAFIPTSHRDVGRWGMGPTRRGTDVCRYSLKNVTANAIRQHLVSFKTSRVYIQIAGVKKSATKVADSGIFILDVDEYRSDSILSHDFSKPRKRPRNGHKVFGLKREPVLSMHIR